MEAQIVALTAQLTDAQNQLAAGSKGNASDSGMQDSYLTLEKDNRQLLERLQKLEGQLQKARAGGNVSDDEEASSKKEATTTITLSPEVIKKLDTIDEKMMEIKRELHLAKSSCI